MGQDQVKAKSTGGGAQQAGPTLDEQYAQEKAKMVHVTTANDVVAETPLYEIEADRLLAQLQAMTVKPPLLVSAIEGNLLLKKEKMIDEINSSPRLKNHKLFHESLVLLLATLQTLSLREGQTALKREEEIILRLQQFAHHAATLRHYSAKCVQQANAISTAAKEAAALEKDVTAMSDELTSLCEFALVLDAELSQEDRHAVRAQMNSAQEKK
jgi:hypothetical protein